MAPRTSPEGSSPARCLIAAALSTSVAVASAAQGAPVDPPFAAASLAPIDADFVLRVKDFPQVWSKLERAPIGRFLASRFEASELAEAWRRFAVERGEDPRSLAEQLLRRDSTWIARRGAEGEEWLLLAKLDDAERRSLLARWRPRPLGRGWFELEQEGVLLFDTDEHLAIAGAGSRDLLVAVATRLASGEPMPSLRDAWSLDARPEIAGGSIECYLDRRPWTDEGLLIEATVDPRLVSIELHAARPDREAMANRSSLSIDPEFASLVGSLRSEHLVVVASAAGVPMPFASEWLAVLPEAAASPALGGAAATRRLWVVGESSGGGDDPNRDLPTPAVAFAIELKDPAEAEERLDRWGEALATGFNRRFPSLASPPLAVTSTIDGGSIDLGPLMRRALGDHPIARRLRVDWSVAAGEHGGWAIVASGPAWLRSVHGAIESRADRRLGVAVVESCDSSAREFESAVQHGWLRGERIGRHFERWSESADRFATPFDREAFAERWRRVAEAATALGDLRWTVVRSPSGSVRTSIRIELPEPSDPVKPDSRSDED